MASQTVKHHILRLIEAENPKKLYSDDDLVTILTQKGIPIARRTVAKYRDALKIPSSYQRKHKFAIKG